jgi:hypothetical protein
MDLPIEIGIAIYHLAKLRKLQLKNILIDQTLNYLIWIQVIVVFLIQKIAFMSSIDLIQEFGITKFVFCKVKVRTYTQHFM